MVEFTLVFPLLLSVMMGVIQFGYVLNNKNTLTNAVAAGARQLSISRGNSTSYTDTINAVKNSASTTLTTSNLTISVSVNSTVCSSDTACTSALSKAEALPATVTASYPCVDFGFSGLLPVMACTLQSTLTLSVQ